MRSYYQSAFGNGSVNGLSLVIYTVLGKGDFFFKVFTSYSIEYRDILLFILYFEH